MHAPTRQAAPRHSRILGFLCLSVALSSALAFVPVPSEQVNRESQIAEIRRFIGHKDAVWSVALAPDGQHALSGSYDQTLRLWDVRTGKELGQFQGHTGPVLSVAFSPHASIVARPG